MRGAQIVVDVNFRKDVPFYIPTSLGRAQNTSGRRSWALSRKSTEA